MEDEEMQRVLYQSMAEQKGSSNFEYEPLNAMERKREPGMPVGLRNVGNTCYFNSLIQTYFNIPEFVELILTLDVDKLAEKPEEEKKVDDKDKKEKEDKTKLIQNLKILFSRLIKSNKKYQDASEVLKLTKDEYGNTIQIGEQRDVSEFHLFFFDALLNSLKPEIKEKEEIKEQPAAPVSSEDAPLEADNSNKDAEMEDNIHCIL
jgi:ubiquitin carboxyl-terminal hydrolase 25